MIKTILADIGLVVVMGICVTLFTGAVLRMIERDK
jgi:hypothetical protein